MEEPALVHLAFAMTHLYYFSLKLCVRESRNSADTQRGPTPSRVSTRARVWAAAAVASSVRARLAIPRDLRPRKRTRRRSASRCPPTAVLATSCRILQVQMHLKFWSEYLSAGFFRSMRRYVYVPILRCDVWKCKSATKQILRNSCTCDSIL